MTHYFREPSGEIRDFRPRRELPDGAGEGRETLRGVELLFGDVEGDGHLHLDTRHGCRVAHRRGGAVRWTVLPRPMPPSAVPWVRIERDPTRYAAVMRRGQRFGPIRNALSVYLLLGETAAKEDQEVAWVVLVDTHGTCRGVQEIARGARDHVGFELPDATRAAVVAGAKYLVLCHNHPSGSAVPSEDDGELTTAVETACFEVGLLLLDHVVLGMGEYFSFRERGLFRVDRYGRASRV